MIRPMQAADVPAVAALDAELFDEHAWSLQAWAREGSNEEPDRRYLVSWAERQLVGYAGIMRTGSDADVLTVAVASRLRRHGHGLALVQALLEVANGWRCLAVFLEVEQDNAAALGLYAGLGFREMGTRRHYYGPDRHAVTMRFQAREPLGAQSFGGDES